MDPIGRTWHLERNAPVRADAEGIFVPRSELPDAVIGDLVVVDAPDGDEARTGTIADTTHLDGEPYVRITFEG